MSQRREYSDGLREALARFINLRGLTITGWCKSAGVTEGTLRSFLAGRSGTLTHATLAALAGAAQEPITALLKGLPAWGDTQIVEVSVQVDAAERSIGSIFLADHERYYLRLPVLFPKLIKFAARISDNSVDEKWGQDSFLICADLGWDSVFDTLLEGDFIVIEEKRSEFIGESVVQYLRCTVRQLVHEGTQDYLVLRSSSPRFGNSIQLPTVITGTIASDPITTGLGTQIRLIGKVLASYCLEDAAKKVLQAGE